MATAQTARSARDDRDARRLVDVASRAPNRRRPCASGCSHALDGIAARHPGERVAVVSHAGAINAALGRRSPGTPHDFVFPLANASISVVRINGERRLLMSANETAHLRAIPPRARA